MKYIQTELPYLMQLSDILNMPLTFVDLETTGRPHERFFEIIEIGVIQITKNSVQENGSLIDPRMKIPEHIIEITGINDSMVRGKPLFDLFIKYFYKVAQEHVLIGYNSKSFDSKGLEKMFLKKGSLQKFNDQLDIFHLFQRCKKEFLGINNRGGSLTEACSTYGIKVPGNAHRASYDIAITALLAEELLKRYGFGIIHKDISKLNSLDAKKRYYNYLVQNKIYPI